MNPLSVAGSAAVASNPWATALSGVGGLFGGSGAGPDTLQSHAGSGPSTVGGLTINKAQNLTWVVLAALAVGGLLLWKKK